MLSFLLYIVIFVFVIIFFVFSMFGRLISSLFGGFKGSQQSGGRQNMGSQNTNSSQSKQEEPKVFSKDEGEYVNFEEIE